MLAGDRALEPVAWTQLNGLRGELTGDAEALDALGVMTAARGDGATAGDLFRRVLVIDGNNLTALSNLGTLMAKEGKLDEAQRFLNAAFARNRDLPGLALNVARVDCMGRELRGSKGSIAGSAHLQPRPRKFRVVEDAGVALPSDERTMSAVCQQ